ncbi:MAG: hypothetical protein MHPSP_004162, partial [Paramarteilia canceri]
WSVRQKSQKTTEIVNNKLKENIEKISTFTIDEILTADDFINAEKEFDKNLRVLDNSEIVDIIVEKNESNDSDQDEGFISKKLEIITFQESKKGLDKNFIRS